MKKLLFLFFTLLTVVSYSQINDDFEDGNLSGWTQSIAGHWAASTDSPINGSYSLHHIFDNNTSAYEMISHSFNIKADTTDIEWRFQIHYNYNPYSTNNWTVFIMSDYDANEMFPSGSANGYAIGVDYSGTSDYLTLWKITSGSATALITTDLDWNNVMTGDVGIVVRRTQTGDWSIYTDNDGGFDNLIQTASTENNVDYITSNYFGIYYEYSSSQDMKLWIDDVYAGVPIPDTILPRLDEITVKNQTQLNLIFSENLDESTAETINNYLVDNSIGNPLAAVLDGTDSKIVDLTFGSSFIENTNYTLDLTNIEDESTNKIKDTSVSFLWQNIKVVSVQSVSTTDIDVKFSKIVDQSTAENSANYSIDNTIGSASSAIIDATDKTLVHLTFSNSMINNQSYNLTVQNVEDSYGNTISLTPFAFVFHQLQQFDVVVNELMIDVNPAPATLPANKYIEIYNTSDFNINLQDWTMTIGSNSAKTFPAITINSNDYAIICSTDGESALGSYGNVIPILTESQLTSTTGKKITIKNSNDEIIYEFTYSTDWYNDENKNSGGWSLERIDPTNYCNQEGNWLASENAFGGTPGTINSIFASNQDTKAPSLITYNTEASVNISLDFSETVDVAQASSVNSYTLNTNIFPQTANIDADDNSIVHLQFVNHFNFGTNSLKISTINDYCGNVINDTTINFNYQLIHPIGVIPLSNNQLKIYFSESVNLAASETENNYTVNNQIGNPNVATRDFSDYSTVYVMFSGHFEEDKEYDILIKGISDVDGNVMHDTTIKFIYHITQYNDLIINEILYNPKTNCSDFIELYNRSNFPIDLQKIRIAKRNDDGEISSDYNLTYSYSLLLPDSFVVVTVDTANISKTYNAGNNLLELSSMPSYSDDEGIVVIIDEKDTIIDEFSYNDDMQFALLTETDGVSLERINYNQSTQDSDNWHSAAENVGYATPGLKNSQYRDIASDSIIGEISINEQVFSPDNDGYNDELYINYNFEENGYIADVSIYDKNGILIRQLVNNQLLSLSGKWVWDGLDDNMRKTKIGIYAVVIKVFDLNGKVNIYKETVVVSAKR